MPFLHGRARAGPLWPLGVLLGVFALVDLLLPAMERVGSRPGGQFLTGLIGGLIAAQAGLLTLWAVFGPYPLALRWITTLGAAEFLLGADLAGSLLVVEGLLLWEAFVIAPLTLPLVFLVLQVPLALIRVVTGWRIALAGREGDSSGGRQFRIVDLLTVMLIVAVTLALARVADALSEPTSEDTAQMWLAAAVRFAIQAVGNALLAMPCFWAVFAAGDKSRAAAILLLYYFLLAFGSMVLLFLLTGKSTPEEGFGVMFVFGVVYLAVLAGSLCLIRAGGYVLVRPCRRTAGAAAVGPDAEQGASPFAPSGHEGP